MEFGLKELKETYSKFAKKYNLPSFDELNHSFEIEKIDRETECFLRVVRKVIMEKVVNAMSFLEMLLNPMNAPRMYVPFVSSMSIEEKKEIERMYGLLADLSISSLELEMDYSEKSEAEIIKESFKLWKEVKNPLGIMIKKIRKPSLVLKKEKSYFG